MTSFDLDFNIDISNILEDFTTEQLVEELKERGAELYETKQRRGFNLGPSMDVRIVIVLKKE